MKKLLAIIIASVMMVGCFSLFTACGKKTPVGVQQGTTGELYVKGNADMLLDGFSNLKAMAYSNAGLAVQAMKDGKVKYVIIDNEPAKMLVDQNSDIKMIDIALTTEEYAFGVDKNQPELLASVNSIIERIKSDGTLDSIFAKYDGLEYDDDGNVIGGDEDIVGIESANENVNNKEGQLVVATNAAFAPYEYKKGNKFVGIDMDIAQLIATELNLELVIKDMEFDAVVTSVGKHGVDIAMAGLSVTASRKQSVNFSTSYYEGAYQVLIVMKDNTDFDNCTTKEQVEEILKTK